MSNKLIVSYYYNDNVYQNILSNPTNESIKDVNRSLRTHMIDIGFNSNTPNINGVVRPIPEHFIISSMKEFDRIDDAVYDAHLYHYNKLIQDQY